MNKKQIMEQLRKAVREVIQEELTHGKPTGDKETRIVTIPLTDKGKPVGYIKRKGNTTVGVIRKSTPKTTDESADNSTPTSDEGEETPKPKPKRPRKKKDKRPIEVIAREQGQIEMFGLDEEGEGKYNPAEIDRAIQASDRAGRRISKSEAAKIHRLLKGWRGNKKNESLVIQLDKLRQTPTYKQILLGSQIADSNQGYPSVDGKVEEGVVDTLRHTGRQVRDTAKGIGRVGKAVLAARRGGDATSMLRLVGQDLKSAYRTPATVRSPATTDLPKRAKYTDHPPSMANILRRLRDFGQDTKIDITGDTRSPKTPALVARLVTQPSANTERDARRGTLARMGPYPDKPVQYYDTSESYTLEEFSKLLAEAGYNVSHFKKPEPTK